MKDQAILSLSEIHGMLSASAAHRPLLSIDRRIAMLKALGHAIDIYEGEIEKALSDDLGRPPFLAYAAESAMIKAEIRCALGSVRAWSKRKRVKTGIAFWPGSSYIAPVPKGLALIIAPWNYPFQLSLVPLVSAIAAGDCAIVKPSEISKRSAEVIADIINRHLDPTCFRAITGGEQVAKGLLELRYDHIFYTGNQQVGSEVMKKAALHLTPVTLELGGKSPAIVDDDCDLMLAARRIAWGKCVNAGQTCIAPDYVLISPRRMDEFIELFIASIHKMFGDRVEENKDYGRIINDRHFARLASYLSQGRIAHGGGCDEKNRFMEPTLLTEVDPEEPVMQEEIFGPILPLVAVEDIDQAIRFIDLRPRPLALYIFSNRRKTIDRVMEQTTSGGVSINDCLSQVGISGLPFGGVGHSGFGSYHGEHGFLTFSHLRAVHRRSTWFDNPIRYAPYSKLDLKIAKLIL